MILPGPRRSWPWSGVALLAAALVGLPILTVLSSLARPEWALWAHLARTQLPELLLNTLGLVTAVGLGVLVLGTTLAWLVVTCEFPGRRLFEWALVLPLALPAYVIGFVFLGLFEYAGPTQTALRGWLGPGARLPDLRSGWGVALMMTLVYYPYVYTAGPRGARRAGAGVPRDRSQPRALASRDPVRRHAAPGAARARRRDRAGLHGGARRFRDRLDVQLPDADRGDLPRVARDVRSDGGDSARGDPPRTRRRPPGARAPLPRAGAVHPRATAGPAPGPAAPHGHPGAGRDRALRGHAHPRLRAARRPALALGPRGARAGQRAGGVPPRPAPEPDARGRRGASGHGGRRAPRLRAPEPAHDARDGRDALRRPRLRLAGGSHRGRRPAPPGLARPRAGRRRRGRDRRRSGPPAHRLGGGPPLRLSGPVPGRGEPERRGEPRADPAEPRRGRALPRRARRPHGPRHPSAARAPRPPGGRHARLRRRDEGAAGHPAPPAVRPRDPRHRHLAANGGVALDRSGGAGARAGPGRARSGAPRDAGDRRRRAGGPPPRPRTP